jgi:hypothetical protein
MYGYQGGVVARNSMLASTVMAELRRVAQARLQGPNDSAKVAFKMSSRQPKLAISKI